MELCPPGPEHAEIFHSWRSQALAQAFNPIRPLSVDELREQLKTYRHELSELRENEQYRWFLKSEGEFVGQVAMSGVNLMMGTAEIGYTVGAAYQGRGLATVGVALLLDRVFSQTTLRRLFAHVHEKNAASIRVLEKLGFTREGLLREHYIVNGAPANEVAFGILRREWSGVRS